MNKEGQSVGMLTSFDFLLMKTKLFTQIDIMLEKNVYKV